MKLKKAFFLIPLIFLISSAGCTDSGASVPAETQETDSGSAALVISPDTVGDFAVIRGDTSEDGVTRSALRLKEYLIGETGLDLKISTDWERNPVYRYEVIIGPTLRPSQLGDDVDMVSIGRNGFTVKCEDGKLYVGGAGSEGTAKAVEWVMDNIRAENGVITVEDGFEHTEAQQYDLKGIYVCGEDTSEWPIAYSSASLRKAAAGLQNDLYDSTGIWHEIREGDAEGRAFRIGFEKPDVRGLFVISEKDGSLCFDSSASGSAEELIGIFRYEYLDYSGNINFPKDYIYIDLGDNLIVSGLE